MVGQVRVDFNAGLMAVLGVDFGRARADPASAEELTVGRCGQAFAPIARETDTGCQGLSLTRTVTSILSKSWAAPIYSPVTGIICRFDRANATGMSWLLPIRR